VVGVAVAAGEVAATDGFSGRTDGESTLHPAVRANKASPTAGRRISFDDTSA
jgi:hypothetical protein